DYSGSVSAEDNLGIGGYDRIMGPNGQAQYRAADIADACRVLLAHHAHAYVAPGERFARRAPTRDPTDRDASTPPMTAGGGFGGAAGAPTSRAARPGGVTPPGRHGEAPIVNEFATVGDVLSDERNPGRKKPFDVRAVMAAVVDRDHAPLERWKDMRDAET